MLCQLWELPYFSPTQHTCLEILLGGCGYNQIFLFTAMVWMYLSLFKCSPIEEHLCVSQFGLLQIIAVEIYVMFLVTIGFYFSGINTQ